MNYTHWISELNQASLFDLYRLHAAIGNELHNPARIHAMKQKLLIGMALSYFHPTENRLIQATLLELKQKTAVVLDREQQRPLDIPYCMLNVEGIDTTIHETTTQLTIHNLAVGDCVGFHHAGKVITGIIQRRSPKTVSLITSAGTRWRVAYRYLYRIHEAEIVVEPALKTITHEACPE